MNPNPEIETMFDYAEKVASEMIEEISEEEAVELVRQYIKALARWQPEAYAKLNGDPRSLALTALSTSILFRKAFSKAYTFSRKHVAAHEALKKALNTQS